MTSQIQADVEDEIDNTAINMDLAANTSTNATPGTSSTPPHSILVGDKMMLKSKLLSMFLRYRKQAQSADRLKRVQEMERFQASQTEPSSDLGNGTQLLLVHDPVATLIYSESRLWLAIGEVNGLWFSGKRIDRVAHSLLKEPEEGGCDWRTYTIPGVSYEVPGMCVEVLAPESTLGADGKPHYVLESRALVATTSLLVQRLPPAALKSLPKRPVTLDYPYREHAGEDVPVGRFVVL